MTLYRNGYLVFTINGHDLTSTFYWSLLNNQNNKRKRRRRRRILFKVKKYVDIDTYLKTKFE